MTLKTRMLVAMAVVAGLLVAASWTVTSLTASYLLHQVDAQLVRFTSGPGGPGKPLPPPVEVAPGTGDSQGLPPEQDAGSFSAVYVGVVENGVVRTRLSPAQSAAGNPVPLIDAGEATRLAREGSKETVDSTAGGTRYRVAARVAAGGEVVVTGLPLDDVDATVRQLVTTEVIATAAVLVVLGLILWWVLRLGVRPVRRMTEAAATIAAGDLSHRVPEEAPGTEAHELGVALNTMLERIEASFAERAAIEARLRRFVADASHELRTPVTTVRGYAELYRLGGLTDGDALDAAMARTESETVRMGRLVEDLLTLARLDEGQRGDVVAVELDRVVDDAVADLRVRHADHPVTVRTEPAVVLGDPDRLHQVVANLLTNAAVHTPAGTQVEVDVIRQSAGVRLVVRDHGPGMDDEAVAQAFERFWRADESRSRASGGSGLGLSIVAAIVSSLGGSVRLERPSDGPGTVAVVDLPAAGAT